MSNPPFLRTSERRDFKRCPQRWHWRWRHGLVPKGRIAEPLWFGTGIHEALAQWYRPGVERGEDPATYWARWVGEEERYIRTAVSDDFNEDEWHEAASLGYAMLESYCEEYGMDPDWDVIATEQSFQINVPHPKNSDILVTYAGTFDGVFRDVRDDTIWLMEHKTAKQISTAHLQLDDQAGSYWAIATKVLRASDAIGPKEQITGILYNFLRKALPDERPRDEWGLYLNQDGTVSKRQPPRLFLREVVDRDRRERATQLRRIQNEALHMEAMRDGTLPLYKNPTRDCAWDCPFYEMCTLHEKGNDDWKEFRDAMFRRVDPYRDHRKSAA